MATRNAIENYIYRQYVACATKRGYSFNLDIDTFFAIADDACVYCKAKNTNKAIRSQYAVKEREYNGVDRMNSDLPYTVGNCVTCCKHCNAAKSAMPLNKFLSSDWLKGRIAQVNI